MRSDRPVCRHRAYARRRAFTLVEMLVVLVLLVIIFTLAMLVAPRISEKRAAARGADQLQGWLLQARSRAIRDQAPRGIRLIPDNPGATAVRQLEFVEQPGNLRPIDPTTTMPALLQIQSNFNPSNPQTMTSPAQVSIVNYSEPQGTVLPGDILEVNLGSVTAFSVAADPATTGGALQTNLSNLLLTPVLTSAQGFPSATYQGRPSTMANTYITTDYRFVRRWRPIPGEEPLQMPKGVVINIGRNANSANPLPLPVVSNSFNGSYVFPPGGSTPNADIVIMFGSNGQLVDTVGATVLWVEDVAGLAEPTQIAVYPRTGSIAAQQVQNLSDPTTWYNNVQDGYGSGL